MRMPAIVPAIAVGVTMYAHNAAAQPTRVTECRTITAPGSYVLAQNLSARGNCLEIDADFVTIDLAGFVISGDGTGLGIRADVQELEGSTRIAVRNGTITGFQVGKFFKGDRHNRQD